MEKYRTARRRFLASLIDGLIFLPLGFLDELILVRTNPALLLVAWLFFTYPIVWVYSVVLHYYFGQTLGKRLLGVTVLDNRTEQRITLRQAFLRDIVFIILNLSLMLLVFYELFSSESVESATFQTAQIAVGYAVLGWASLEIVTCLFSEKRRALHDFIAGTVVVKTEAVKQGFASNSVNF